MNFLIGALIFLASTLTTFVATPHVPALPPVQIGEVATEDTDTLGSVVPLAPANFETSLAAPISSSATTMTLTANAVRGGSTFAGYSCFTIDEGSAQAEYVCGTISGTTVSDMTRGIDPLTGTTTVTALKFAHRRGASVKVTDAPILTLIARILRGEDTVSFTPSEGGSLVTKTYVDSLALGTTTVSATESDDGVVELATLAEALAGTATGDSGSKLVLQSSHVPSIADFAMPIGSLIAYSSTTAPTGWLLADGTGYSTTTYPDLFSVVGYTYGGSGSTFQVPDLRSSVPLGGGTARTRVITFVGDSGVDPSTDTITVASNDWLHTGQAVALTGSSLPTGLSATTYYVIRTSATAIKLATSVANANAGTAIDITADGSGTCTLTQTLTARTVGATGGEEIHALTDAEMASHSHIGYTLSSSGATPYMYITELGDTNPVTSPAGSDTPHNTMPPYTVVQYIIKY